jgi:hypothetical protein
MIRIPGPNAGIEVDFICEMPNFKEARAGDRMESSKLSKLCGRPFIGCTNLELELIIGLLIVILVFSTAWSCSRKLAALNRQHRSRQRVRLIDLKC